MQGGDIIKISYKESVVKTIESFEAGTVFIANDFLEIASYERIRILNRLERIKLSTYFKWYIINRNMELIDEYEAPSVHQVARHCQKHTGQLPFLKTPLYILLSARSRQGISMEDMLLIPLAT